MKGDTCVLLGVKELRLLSSMYTLALRHPTLGTTPPTSTPFWRIVETRWCSANSTPTIPSGSPKQEMTGEQPEGRLSTGRSAVRNSLCKPISPYPTPLPGRQGQPSSPDITLLSGNLLPDVAWSTKLDLTTTPRPHRGKRVLLRTSARLAGREFAAETERNTAPTPWPDASSKELLEQEPGGVNLAEKVTNFDMVSNDLHI